MKLQQRLRLRIRGMVGRPQSPQHLWAHLNISQRYGGKSQSVCLTWQQEWDKAVVLPNSRVLMGTWL